MRKNSGRKIAKVEAPPNAAAFKRVGYRINEAAALTGFHRRTIERMMDDGRLKFSARLGRKLIDPSSIELFTRHEGERGV
jgi:excisionase family DNA binding protein